MSIRSPPTTANCKVYRIAHWYQHEFNPCGSAEDADCDPHNTNLRFGGVTQSGELYTKNYAKNNDCTFGLCLLLTFALPVSAAVPTHSDGTVDEIVVLGDCGDFLIMDHAVWHYTLCDYQR